MYFGGNFFIMKNRALNSGSVQENSKKRKYESPKVEFTPLRIEERLLACACKSDSAACHSGGTLGIYHS